VRGVTDEVSGAGARMHDLVRRMYPICRSITGSGVRQTLDIIGEHLPLQRVEVPSGTQAHDWTVSDEWNVADAYIADKDGRRLVDFREHNLHLVGYSVPVRATMTLAELRPHLHTHEAHPDWIPYRTTYYHRDWGFCLSQRQLDALGEGPFEVVVDTTLQPGSLSYAELLVPGEVEDELLLSAHICHPSMANDNLSGIAVSVELAQALLRRQDRRLSYRFLFSPGTIGSIVWLSEHAVGLPNIRHGLVLTGLGGPGPLVYKRTRHGRRPIDRAAAHVVSRLDGDVRDYSPYGYDERQFNAIGFDLPVGRLSRTPHGEYPEYHTSADDLDFVRAEQLADSLGALLRILEAVEHDAVYRNLSPYGEPQLGRRKLYPTMGGRAASDEVMAMLWTLAYSDGSTSLLDIAERGEVDFTQLRAAATKLADADLLERVEL
jgi:aminopeptidase-like protein